MDSEREKELAEKKEQLKKLIDKVTEIGTIEYLLTFIALGLDLWTHN